MRKSETRVAVIDLGTTSLRIEIYRVDIEGYLQGKKDSALELLHRQRHMPRLGRGLYESGRLNPEGCRDTLQLLEALQLRIKEFEVEYAAAAATSAIREAEDGEAFIAQLESYADLPIRVLSGREEAAYTARGITALEPQLEGEFVFVDIGGGSTEFSRCRDRISSEPKSLPLGAIRHNFKFLRCSPDDDNPPEPAAIEAMRKEVALLLASELPNWKAKKLIGSSGTVRTLCKLSFLQKKADGALTAEELSAVSSLLCEAGFSKRCEIKGLERKRADIVVAGSILLDEIFTHLEAESIRASLYSLRHGLLDEAIQTASDSSS